MLSRLSAHSQGCTPFRRLHARLRLSLLTDAMQQYGPTPPLPFGLAINPITRRGSSDTGPMPKWTKTRSWAGLRSDDPLRLVEDHPGYASLHIHRAEHFDNERSHRLQ